MPEITADEVEEFLGSPAAYDLLPDAQIARIDTHISVIFLAGSFAYKLKKRVDLSYLNFTTLEARYLACQHELALNRRTAPSLYLDIVPIRVKGTELALGPGKGDVVDWVVKMEQFEQASLLSKMADRGVLTLHLTRKLARKIEMFHRAAEVRKNDGGANRFAEILESNQKNFLPFLGSIYPPSLIETLSSEHGHALEGIASLLDQRRASGWVRHCHGDLHLNNVVCLNDDPVPFDCIEFNDSFARIDMLYDLAFLLMDLAFRAKGDDVLFPHANGALNAYLQHQSPGDLAATLQGLKALPFFMSLRAGVRSHVNAQMIESAGADRAKFAGLALAYAEFAVALLQPTQPTLYAIGGLSGTGKTTIAKFLAPELGHTVGAVHLRTDTIRKRLAGVDDAERLPASAYTQRASDAVYAEMAHLAARALDAGQSVISDAVFAKPAEREAIEQVAHARSLPFRGIWLISPLRELEARVDRRARAGDDASDAGLDVVRQQLSYDFGRIDWASVDTSGVPEAAAERVRSVLDLTIE